MAGTPWGNSRYPPYPAHYASAPAAPGPAAFDPRRAQYTAPPPAAGFYNAAIMQHAQGPADPRMRQMSMMAMPQPNIPPILQPGAGPRATRFENFRSNSGDLSGDLLFREPPRMPMPMPVPQVPTLSSLSPPQIRHSVSAPAPPLPKKPSFDVPPLPPKPSKTSPPGTLPLYPQSANSPRAVSQPSTSYAQTPVDVVPENSYPALAPSPPVEEDRAFRAALEQSRRDAEAARQREEEELAKAMQESLSLSSQPPSAVVSPIASGSRSSYYDPGPSPGASTSFGSPSPALISTNPFVQSPESVPLPTPSLGQLSASPPSTSQQIHDDEALARQLAEEEEQSARQKQDEERARALVNAQAAEQARQVASQLALPPRSPPEYPTVASPSFTSHPPTIPEGLPLPTPESSTSGTPSPIRSGSSSPDIHRHRSSSALPPSAPLYEDTVRAGRSQSFGAYSSSAAANRPSLPRTPSSNGHRSAAASPKLPSVPEKAASSVSSHATNEKTSSVGHSHSSPNTSPEATPRPASQYVDTELLRGVSIGFNPPAISAVLAPMDGPIPNVIALPYGRAPPLHIKAPNWRDLLQLMARLSNTRLEPTLEATAVVKTTMHLRVVINFVKVHASSNDWHVVLYMTIDYPIPDGHRYKSRNQNDPALLPYSYTLSPQPAFLRESADSPLSKWYCVPATPQNAYPSLPMNFPDLATYLMSALEDSRRAAHDRSSGWHRLAKAVDSIYPPSRTPGGADDDDADEPSRFSLRGIFGRGSKQNRPANDDRSTLVTPFYADDYGR
ncbi:hypothetical protein PsYK624_001810 [Phanerochaete sordida]|uniref:Uncharacterized protein n=1 Tax=Phanerochaete sordida TaxID=48140 RepID=A0A9P3FWY0_9APHY|nr:hypothetical protein PsYK624_001810 [Phanerochaete sordida]